MFLKIEAEHLGSNACIFLCALLTVDGRLHGGAMGTQSPQYIRFLETDWRRTNLVIGEGVNVVWLD